MYQEVSIMIIVDWIEPDLLGFNLPIIRLSVQRYRNVDFVESSRRAIVSTLLLNRLGQLPLRIISIKSQLLVILKLSADEEHFIGRLVDVKSRRCLG